MIRRIVKMTFREEGIERFYPVFNRVKHDILQFPGCRSLQLLRAKDNPAMLFTLSTWDREEDLDVYRSSELFRETWIQTKALFKGKAEAWTVEILHTSDES